MKRQRISGFTLIEVMVVLVVMGAMASVITLGLSSMESRETTDALKRLRLVLEASADRAATRGQPIAIELLPDGYRFSSLDAHDNWRPLIDPPVFTDRTLPPGVAWGSLHLEGHTEPAPPRLQFGTHPPEYTLRIVTPLGQASLNGRRNGEVRLVLPGDQAS